MSQIRQLHSTSFYERRAHDYYLEGRRCARDKRFQEALENYREAVRFAPRISEYHYCAGVMSRLLDEETAAYSFLQCAYEMSPDIAAYQKDFALIAFRQGEYEQAKQLLEDLRKKEPEDRETRLHLGRLEATLGHVEDASILFRSLLESCEDWEAAQELGSLYMENHHYGLSEKYFRQSIAWNGEDIFSYYSLSKVYLKQGRHQKAVEVLTELKTHHPAEGELVDKNIEVIELLMSL